MAHLRRDFTSDLSQLAAMRTFLRDAVAPVWSAPSDEERLSPLELALGEAAANVILHAYQGEKDRPIEMVVDADGNRIRVELFHRGKSFDRGKAAEPCFDGSKESGFGLYLIEHSVDRVEYMRDERGWQGVRLVQNRK